MRRAALAIAVLLAAAAPALAAEGAGPWATVNVCDTAAHPDVIGIRAAMPGLGQRAAGHMRFSVQYRSRTDGAWRDVGPGADSGWHRVGSIRRRALESGWSFAFRPPPAGERHVLRGVVRFEWRRGRRVLRAAREVTEAGHRSTTGADPPGYSAATCEIR
jgi:hypothetical protein